MTHKLSITRLLKTASPEASKITFSACAILAIKVLLLNRYNALFFGAYELGIIFEAILASVVASYIFYIFVVHLKELRDRDAFEPYFRGHATRIVSDCISCLREISEKSGIDLNFFTCTNEKVIEALFKTNPSAQANFYLGSQNRHATVQEFFWFNSETSRTSCKCLLEKLNFMTVEETKLISDIEECSYFRTSESILYNTIKNTDCSFLTSSLCVYINCCRRLNTYAKAISSS
jgi:hypothetical protein